MENAPIIPPPTEALNDTSLEKDKKKKKRRGFDFGRTAVEAPKPDKQDIESKSEKPKQTESTEASETGVVNVEKSLDKEVAMQSAIAETAPVSESEAPSESIGNIEASEIEPQIAEIAREMDPEPDPVVEHFRDKIIEEGKDSETAYAETMAELGIDIDSEQETIYDTDQTKNLAETKIEPDSAEELNEDEGELIIQRDIEAQSDNLEDDTAAAGGAGGSGSVPPTINAGAGGGAGGLPPHGQGPRFTPNAPAAFNTAPMPTASPNTQRQNYDYLDDRASPAAMALFGGIIGYLIGRRRGRIKTEKKLLPIQKKLEKQVNNLQWEIKEKESKLRRAAALKVKTNPTIIEKFVPVPAVAAKRAERAQKTQIITEQRRKAPEAKQLHAAQTSSERIGHMLMAAESTTILRSERFQTETERSIKKANEKLREIPPELMNERRVETLNRAELLAMSEKIVVGGSSLRQIYETKLIGERGLRRLIAEHLHGGDIKKTLRHEIVEREIDFERDPAMRDLASSASGGGAAGKATLDELVQHATANMPHDDEETAYYRARASYESDQYTQQQRHRQVMDKSMIAIILILIALVVLLIITRS